MIYSTEFNLVVDVATVGMFVFNLLQLGFWIWKRRRAIQRYFKLKWLRVVRLQRRLRKRLGWAIVAYGLRVYGIRTGDGSLVLNRREKHIYPRKTYEFSVTREILQGRKRRDPELGIGPVPAPIKGGEQRI